MNNQPTYEQVLKRLSDLGYLYEEDDPYRRETSPVAIQEVTPRNPRRVNASTILTAPDRPTASNEDLTR